MIGFCIEASHWRGLGHLYKCLNILDHLSEREPVVVMLNDDPVATALLGARGVHYITVDLNDLESGWEERVVAEFGITIWVNDRLDTDIRHAEHVKRCRIPLVTFDDRGGGAALADLHFAPLLFGGQHLLEGKKVLSGINYLVLNREIDVYRRQRDNAGPILVTLGGCDTHGVTPKVVSILKNLNLTATVLVGPSFQHQRELYQLMEDDRFVVKQAVPSLIQEMSLHDLAITGGGVTAFEANASGLPCIIVANEPHEIEMARYLEGLGSSIFAGFHRGIDESIFDRRLDIPKMSHAGMSAIGTGGAGNITREILAL